MKYEPYTVADVKAASDQKLFTVMSCFAGGGGSSTGYRLAGGDIRLINEFVAAAVETYTANFPDTPVLADDIKKYTGQDFLEKASLSAGELDILDGSPPCSAFSVAGKRDKGWNQTKTYSDGMVVENIEDLFYEFIRIMKDVRPKVVVAENVKGITFGTAKGKLNQFVNAFEAEGYSMSYKVLNAADYGVPQARERTIFIGVRDDVCDAIGLNFLNIHGIFPEPTYREYVSLAEGLEGIENDPAEIEELLNYVQNGFQKNWIPKLPFNPTRHTKPSDPQYKSWNPTGSCFNMIRPAPALPCPTLTQRGQQMSVSGVFHPAENRKFTIKELKRIMGLPEDYILTGKFDKQAERIGRAVAPKMMAAVAKSIYEKVLVPYYDATK